MIKLYKESPASISVITGKWKTGKTDFALFLTIDELRDRLGIVEKVGTNIWVDDPTVSHIDNFVDLETWLFMDRKKKAFIFDEALKAAPSRSAMSKLNVKWLEYIPELSKARTHLFIITQEESFTEKMFLHPTFVRARWIKRALKVVDLISDQFDGVNRFTDIPKSKVNFDPYKIATWSLEPKGDLNIVDNDILLAVEYANNSRTHEIMKKYGLKYRSDLTNALRRAIKKMYNVYKRSERVKPENLTTTEPQFSAASSV
ncbi:MAG: hypothetical protein H5T34_04270 [Candidatus Methanomethyliales bacterium]|nr:hypothetical protein [Candidatus Methanomethylicales archaeon]